MLEVIGLVVILLVGFGLLLIGIQMFVLGQLLNHFTEDYSTMIIGLVIAILGFVCLAFAYPHIHLNIG